LFLLSLQGLPLDLFLTIGGVSGDDTDFSIEHNHSHEQKPEWPGKCRFKKVKFSKNATLAKELDILRCKSLGPNSFGKSL